MARNGQTVHLDDHVWNTQSDQMQGSENGVGRHLNYFQFLAIPNKAAMHGYVREKKNVLENVNAYRYTCS